MKISTCTVTHKGFGKHKKNNKRLKLLEKLITELKNKNVQLAILPAGYLTAKNSKHAKKLAARAHELANGINIFVGIDINKKNECDYGCLSLSENKKPTLIQQISYKGEHTNKLTTTEYNNRLQRIGDRNIFVLMCGEIFNRTIKQDVINSDANVIVDLVHKLDGSFNRIFGTAKSFSKLFIQSKRTKELRLLLSCHVDNPKAKKHHYKITSDNVNNLSCEQADAFIFQKPTIRYNIWNI